MLDFPGECDYGGLLLTAIWNGHSKIVELLLSRLDFDTKLKSEFYIGNAVKYTIKNSNKNIHIIELLLRDPRVGKILTANLHCAWRQGTDAMISWR